MYSSIVQSGDTGTAGVYPVISTILWVIVDLQHRRIIGSCLLYVISPANAKRSGYHFLNDILVKHLHMKEHIKG